MAKEKVARKDKNEVKENLTKGEKRAMTIIPIVGFVLILLVIFFSITWGGEKAKIASEYSSLSKDNVFEYIEMNEIKEKIEAGEDFHLYIGNKNVQDANDFVSYIDEYVKTGDYNVEKVYYIDVTKLTITDRTYFTNFNRNIDYSKPIIMHFIKTLGDESNLQYASFLVSLEAFGNYYKLLGEYFRVSIQTE